MLTPTIKKGRTLWQGLSGEGTRGQKKGIAASLEDKTIDPNGNQRIVESGRRPAKER